MAKPIMAIMYDFDKTLALDDMQNFGFIPSLGMTPEEFWGKTGEFAKATGVEKILSYMYMMVAIAKEKGIALTREWLKEQGANIKFFPGVTTWFQRVNDYGEQHGVKVEHYLLSSGTKEIVDGCQIAKEFKAIYGCEFYYGEDNTPIWPKLAINYTQKTQYFFRISKGTLDANNDKQLNEKTPERRIPYRNMVYLGDGMTDVPCMILVKENGGKSIAVYSEGEKEKVLSLFNEGRVNYIARADYSSGSDLEKVIKLLIDSIEVQSNLDKKEQLLLKKE